MTRKKQKNYSKCITAHISVAFEKESQDLIENNCFHAEKVCEISEYAYGTVI